MTYLTSYKKKADPFSNHQFKKEIELMSRLPKVMLTKNAYNTMWHLVDIATKEVSWLGTVEKLPSGDFLINEIFLFKQEVSQVTTEISADGLAEVAQEILLGREDGVEVCNKLQFWGHSHVEMGTSPSAQDEIQMQTFRESGHPYFLRGILNKKGRMEFTVFLYDSGLKISDPEWAIYEPIDQTIREKIETEFTEKVSEKTYVYSYAQNNRKTGIGMGFNNWPEDVKISPGKKSKKTKKKKGGYLDGYY